MYTKNHTKLNSQSCEVNWNRASRALVFVFSVRSENSEIRRVRARAGGYSVKVMTLNCNKKKKNCSSRAHSVICDVNALECTRDHLTNGACNYSHVHAQLIERLLASAKQETAQNILFATKNLLRERIY